jgi:hypothetical protein
MQIAKLVPKVAVLERGTVRNLEVMFSCYRLEHGKVCGFGFMPTRQQPVHGSSTALGSNPHQGA